VFPDPSFTLKVKLVDDPIGAAFRPFMRKTMRPHEWSVTQ
jgi:hypothetical protein